VWGAWKPPGNFANAQRVLVRAMNLKSIGQTVLTIVVVLVALKFVKPMLPTSIANYLP
jgi:hypothetical protein